MANYCIIAGVAAYVVSIGLYIAISEWQRSRRLKRELAEWKNASSYDSAELDWVPGEP